MNKSLLKWFGGKFYLMDDLLPFPNHSIFIDVFGGSGVVSLNHPYPDKVVLVYNDINKRLINFWKVVQKYPDTLKEICITNGYWDSRQIFEECKEEVENEIIDAFNFFYVNRHSFSGNNICYHGVDEERLEGRHHHGYFTKIDEFKKIARQIKKWQIENQDCYSLIKRFKDRSNTLLYLDPPYKIGGEQYENMIGNDINKDYSFDIKKMCELIVDVKCKCIISYDDLSNLELLIKNGWNIEKIERRNRFSIDNRDIKIEYVIRNFDPIQKLLIF